jgi:hypothetical protein
MTVLKNLFKLLLSFILLTQSEVIAAKKDSLNFSNKNRISFYWGYNRSAYSKSDIHFSGPDYDFTLYNLTAHDRPSPSGINYFNPVRLSIPQYNIRTGYFVTDRFQISFGWDHMKYVVDQKQKALISGVISENASQRYAGTYLNDTVMLDYDFIKFEHTDGFNVASLDFEYMQPVTRFFKDKIRLKWNVGLGGVWVVTKTDVTMFGDGMNNDFHVAGFSLQAKTGPRIEWKNKFFLASEFKTGYVTLPWVLIKNEAPQHASHNLIYYEGYVVVGVYLDVINKLFKKNN